MLGVRTLAVFALGKVPKRGLSSVSISLILFASPSFA